MAQNVGTAFVDIRANTTNFEKQLEQSVAGSLTFAQAKAKEFGTASSQSMLKLSDSLTSVGKDLTRKVSLPLAAIGTGALLTSGNFEAGMNKVRAITGATEVEIKQLSDQAKELGASTKFSATEAADAMSFLGMAGFKTSQIVGAMPGTLQLAAAANMGLAEAADITSNVLSGFGIAVDELGSVNDALVKTLTRTNTDLSMLGQAFKFVGPVAKGAGVSFNETAAAIGLLGNAGIQAGMAGTSLRGAITALLNPSAQVSGIMASLGLNVKDANGELLPLNEIIEQLERSGASTGEMMQIFGQRAGPAMMALVEQGSAALRDLTAELDNSGGTAENIANIQMEGFNGQMTSLKSAVEGLMIAIGESGLLNAMTRFAEFVTSIARAMTNMNPAILTAATAFGGLAVAAGPVLLISGSMIRNFVTMRATLVALRTSTIGATVAMGALKVALIGVPLLAVAAGVFALVNRFQQGRRSAEAFADGVKEIADRMGQGEQATDIATERLRAFIDQSPRLQQALSNASFSFDQFVAASTEDMALFQQMTDELMTNYGETFVGTLAYHNGRLSSSVQETMQGFRNELLMLTDGLSAGADGAAFWAEQQERSARLAAQGFELMTDITTDNLNRLADEFLTQALASEDALRVLGDAADLAAREIETELERIEGAAEDLANEIDRAMQSAVSSFLQLSEEGKQNIETFIEETLVGAARLREFQDNVVAIAAATSGEFGNYLLSMGVDAEQLVRDLADPRKAADLDRAFATWQTATGAASRNIADEFAKIDPEFKKTLDGIAGLTDRELQAITDLAERRAVEIGTAMIQGQVQGITANSPRVQAAIRDAVRQAINAALTEADIRSPSRVMADEVGRPLAEGVAVGITEGSGEIDAAMRRTIQEALLNAAQELEKRISDVSARTGDSFFRNLVPKPEDLAAVEEVRDKVTGEIKEMGREALSAADVWINGMIDRTRGLSRFQDNVLRIADLTSGEFGLYLLEMGADAEHLVRELADPAKVAQLDQAYAAWLDSTAVATRDMVSEFGKVDPGFAEVLANLSITIEEEVKPAIESARSGGRRAGSALVSGTVAGINAELPYLRAAIAERDALLTRPPVTAPPFTQGGPGGFGPEGEAGLYGGPVVKIDNATFNNGIGAEAIAQRIVAAGDVRFL